VYTIRVWQIWRVHGFYLPAGKLLSQYLTDPEAAGTVVSEIPHRYDEIHAACLLQRLILLTQITTSFSLCVSFTRFLLFAFICIARGQKHIQSSFTVIDMTPASKYFRRR